ncbi:uncharacterized protein J3R85_017378 [Psidium guajava]|nr:uncharacterized protein J3R85_017378 [Psidium guajava]
MEFTCCDAVELQRLELGILGNSLKKMSSRITNTRPSSRSSRVRAVIDEGTQTEKDKWRGLAHGTSGDQQDINRGKGMFDSLS